MRFRLTRKAYGTRYASLLVFKATKAKLPQALAQVSAWVGTRRMRRDLALACPAGKPFIAIAVTGGIGDFIILARFVRDMAAAIDPCVFDVYSPTPERAAWLFRIIPGFRSAYHDVLFEGAKRAYDVALRADQTLVVYGEIVRWDRLRESAPLRGMIRHIMTTRRAIDRFVSQHPWMDNELARFVVAKGKSRRDFLQDIAGVPYGGDRFDVPVDRTAPARLGLSGRRYVTVHNGYDTNFAVGGRQATKCYPHFSTVIRILKQRFPEFIFVQVGSKTSRPIAECGVSLLQKTNLDEVAGVIAGAALHFDNESGLVHLASCVGTPCAVVFGPTPSDFFGYPGNCNIDPPVCGNCWWLKPTWMDMCVNEYAGPRCMTEQAPEVVAERVGEALGRCQAVVRG